jgi:DNA-directed RNA polymerase specialized sigma24 family protein
LGEKAAKGKSLSKRRRTLASLYERVTDEPPSEGLDLVAWAEGLFALIEERYSQSAMMYFVDGLTYREIGQRLSINHQIVDKRVRLFIKEAKKITKR